MSTTQSHSRWAFLMAWSVLLLVLAVGCIPPEPTELIHKGIHQYELGKLDAAQATLIQARNIDPGNPVAMYYLGRVYHAQGYYEMAIYYYQSCLDLRPDYPTTREYLDQARQDAGKAGEKLQFMPPAPAQE
jgi:tetratricopeptide (TPR) repeat protein